jgi:hypothetical protein
MAGRPPSTKPGSPAIAANPAPGAASSDAPGPAGAPLGDRLWKLGTTALAMAALPAPRSAQSRALPAPAAHPLLVERSVYGREAAQVPEPTLGAKGAARTPSAPELSPAAYATRPTPTDASNPQGTHSKVEPGSHRAEEGLMFGPEPSDQRSLADAVRRAPVGAGATTGSPPSPRMDLAVQEGNRHERASEGDRIDSTQDSPGGSRSP